MSVDTLLETAEARWTALAHERPDLEPAIALQRQLVQRSLQLGGTVEHQLPVQVELGSGSVSERLRDRRPAFDGSTFEVEPVGLDSFVLGFCHDLATGAAAGPAERLRATFEQRRIDIGSLLASSLMRQLSAVRTTANHLGVAPDLLWLVAELVAAPLANRLLQRLLIDPAVTDPSLRATLSGWQEGCCPACGSWPALAERLDGARWLRCSFCGSAWSPSTHRCIYCREEGEALLIASADGGDTASRLELCRTCGGYLKSVMADAPTPFELLAVADLASSDLDVGAANRGYLRPPMSESGTV